MLDASEVKTGKLYYEDAYAAEFTARIERIEGQDVILDRTAFFPEEGGQSPDHGELFHEAGSVRVLNVQIRDGEIRHTVEDTAAFSEGDTVCGRIDWEERFSNMQQHSGEHLFSGIVHRRYGFNNVGFHLSASEVTLDFDGVIPAEDLPEIVREVNLAITSDIPSEVLMTKREEREGLEYRSKLDLPGEVRIVFFPGVDACACCAPHVRRTGEIGVLVAAGMIHYKTGVRVSILCGRRALEKILEEQKIVTDTARYLTTSPSEILPQAVRVKEEIRALKEELKETRAALLDLKIRELPEDGSALLFMDGVDAASAREAVNRMTKSRAGLSAVFAGNDEDGYHFTAGTRDGDAREAARVLREMCGARGGGSPAMVEGSVKAHEDRIREALSGF